MLEKLPKIKGIYRQNAKLNNWFGIETKAEILFKPADINDLSHFLKNCPKEIPITILGAASNVIICDEGVKGVVIRLGSEFAKISYDEKNCEITSGAASLCASVALFSQNNSCAKLEFLSGVPGSIGGAIAMNAGCYGSDISQILKSVKALDYQGNIHIFQAKDCNFSYRKNAICDKYIFVEACFKGEKSSFEEVSKKIQELCKKREETQPIKSKTGGSTFKNPFPNDLTQKKAWQLIDEAGFRGKNIGDAQFSSKHCNFMINTNKSTAKDLINLAKSAQKAVKDKFDIDLELEIKVIK
jgi:UDP-N-acetylmuramate dehydrogenase